MRQKDKKISIKYVVKKHLPEKKSNTPPLFTPEEVAKLKTAGSVVLGIVVAAGALTIAAMAPNALQLIKFLPGLNKRNKRYSESEEIAKAVYYLRDRGYVELLPRGNDYEIRVTKKGHKRILKFDLQKLEVPRPEKWDGKWWIIIADVPINERVHAGYLRDKFKAMCFFPLQKTVWVYPYDPRDQVDFVSSYFSLERFLTILRADKLDPEDEKELTSFFKEHSIL